jgi:hypothetical protein
MVKKNTPLLTRVIEKKQRYKILKRKLMGQYYSFLKRLLSNILKLAKENKASQPRSQC